MLEVQCSCGRRSWVMHPDPCAFCGGLQIATGRYTQPDLELDISRRSKYNHGYSVSGINTEDVYTLRWPALTSE
jgi:hypothetical protein